MRQTHYQRLGVPFGAPEKAIKKAFRDKARQYHPDRHPPEKRDWARKKFSKFKEAYQTLTDPRERALYDRNLIRSGNAPLRKEDFWEFWRQYLSKNPGSRGSLSYHEKMIMDSYEEDWLEEMHGGTATDRHKFRKHLNFGKLHLAEGNLEEAKKEFIRADTSCRRNILSKFYVGYCMELLGEYTEALKRYRFAANIGLERPDKYVNKCLKIRKRMVNLYRETNQHSKARAQEKTIKKLKQKSEGFDQFISSEEEDKLSPADRSTVKDFLKWLLDAIPT